MQCEAIVLRSGVRCTKAVFEDGTRCKVHTKSMISHGPYATKRKELKVQHDVRVNGLFHDLQNDLIPEHEYSRQLREMNAVYRDSLYAINEERLIEMRETGVDPDRAAVERKYELKIVRRNERRANAMRVFEENIANARADNIRRFEELNANARGLAAFAADNQNVHTNIMVEQTKNNITKIRMVAVPDEYRWNTSSCSKTPGEIIMECKLSPDAALQMIMKYSSSEPIYEIEDGIYGKVMDSVWQYVKNHTEKESLIGIVKSELEDNVGMCAQGNLTRICNIVSGYMDGLEVKESPVEMIRRLMPAIADIEDTTKRLNEANRVLLESKLPKEEWLDWAGALFSDEKVGINAGKLVLLAPLRD